MVNTLNLNRLQLVEPPVAADPTSNTTQAIPTYAAFSASGNVEAEVVYVNYGRKEDYDYLAQIGCIVNGTIVLARYGSITAGAQAMLGTSCDYWR